MALVFPDDFYLVGVTPQSAQYDLDKITRHWKTNGATEEEVLLCPTIPKKGDPHPDFDFMFVTDVQAQETAEKSCAMDVQYMGAFHDDPDNPGSPLLPPPKNESDASVSTSSSKKTSGGLTLSDMATVQYYAPTNTKSFYTYGGQASNGFAPDPPSPLNPLSIITLTISDTSFSPTSNIVSSVALLFTTRVVHTLRAPEVVAGKYWQNISKKTNTFFPWIFTISPGNYILMVAPGQGYTVGNIIIISDGKGHTANIKVTVLGLSNSIANYEVLQNTFNYNSDVIYSVGGSGSGAAFANYNIP